MLFPTFVFALVWSLFLASASPITRRAPLTLAVHDNSLISAVTALSATDISDLVPLTQLARAAYCDPKSVQDWTCGAACEAVPGFQTTLTGGDGNAVQFFFVGYWADANTVVVSHQGTDPLALMAILTNLDLLRDPLDPVLFPGAPAGATAHSGFQEQHAMTAMPILEEVKRLLAATGSRSVTLIGHSLGGALAELDCLFLALNLPENIAIKGVTFGTPRVGDDEFAAFFDAVIPDFQRVNNKSDLVPIIPGRGLGYVHPKGELHLLDGGRAVQCPGNDNDNEEDCQIQTVPNLLFGNLLDHLVFNGIPIGSIFCF